jgi:hypothetical protein
MKLVAPGLIKLTWLEWEQHTDGIEGLGLSWWQHPLKHIQHWFCGTFLGHTTGVALDEFVKPDQVIRVASLSDGEIDELMNAPPQAARETKWSGL